MIHFVSIFSCWVALCSRRSRWPSNGTCIGPSGHGLVFILFFLHRFLRIVSSCTIVRDILIAQSYSQTNILVVCIYIKCAFNIPRKPTYLSSKSINWTLGKRSDLFSGNHGPHNFCCFIFVNAVCTLLFMNEWWLKCLKKYWNLCSLNGPESFCETE